MLFDKFMCAIVHWQSSREREKKRSNHSSCHHRLNKRVLARLRGKWDASQWLLDITNIHVISTILQSIMHAGKWFFSTDHKNCVKPYPIQFCRQLQYTVEAEKYFFSFGDENLMVNVVCRSVQAGLSLYSFRHISNLPFMSESANFVRILFSSAVFKRSAQRAMGKQCRWEKKNEICMNEATICSRNGN